MTGRSERSQERAPRVVPQAKAEAIALVGIGVQAIIGVLTLAVYFYLAPSSEFGAGGPSALLGEVLYLAPGLVIWLLCFLRLRMARLAYEEARELEQLRDKAQGSTSLFDTEEPPDAYSAQGRLSKLEKILVPGVTVLTAVGMIAGAAWIIHSVIPSAPAPNMPRLPKSAAFLTAFAFAAFVYSQYVIGLSRDPAHAKLRPAGAYLLSNSLFLALCAVALVMSHAELPLCEKIVQWTLPVLVALLGVEYIVNFVLDFFRPRAPSQELRPPYDSRLLGIFAQPGDIWTTIAETLDYQFGFRVSRTWFYTFLARLFLPLIAFQVIFALALSCLVIVQTNESVIIARFGRFHRVLGPSIHVKLPWPLEKTVRVPEGRIYKVTIGFHGETKAHEEKKSGHHHHKHKKQKPKIPENLLLWTSAHLGHDYFLVGNREAITKSTAVQPSQGKEGASGGSERPGQQNGPAGKETRGRGARGGADVLDVTAGLATAVKEESSAAVNVLNLALAIHFTITDPMAYATTFVEPARYMERVALQELSRICSSVDIDDLMGSRRFDLADVLRERVRKRTASLGIKIVNLGFMNVHPPPDVADVFELELTAMQKKERLITDARAEAARIVENARSQANVTILEAEAYRIAREEASKAAMESYGDQESAFAAGPNVFVTRHYLSMLEEALKGKRIIFVPSNMSLQAELNLEKALGADILNVEW